MSSLRQIEANRRNSQLSTGPRSPEGKAVSCFNALKSGGTIAIGEWLVNDERTEPLAGLIFAVNMLVHSEQGDTFSFNEIKSWLEAAGFKNAHTVEAPGPSPLVLATKP